MHPVMDRTQEDQQTTQHSSELTTETTQKDDEILTRYEEMFGARYTNDDPAYKPYIGKEMDPPPIVMDYFVRRQRSDWNDNAQGQGNRGRGYKRRYDDRERQGDTYQSKRPFPDNHSRQDRNRWNRPGRGSRPPRGQQDRRYDDRHRGGQSSSRQESSEPEWT